MAFKIIWTKQTLKGYDKIINYLEENWSEKEVVNFVNEADKFFETLILQPKILQRTAKYKNVHRDPLIALL